MFGCFCISSAADSNPAALSPFDLSGSAFASQDDLFFELSRRSNWKQWQVRMLYCSFTALIRAHCPPAVANAAATLSKAAFHRVFFAELNAGIPRENAIVESFFATFDHDRSGDIDFCEFVGALSLLCSAVPLPQRTQLIYSLLDVDQDGLLHRNEINAFVRLALKSQGIEQQSSQIDELSRSAFELKLQLHAQPSVLSTKSSAWTHNSKSIKLERSSDSKVDALGPTSFDAWLQTRPHLLQSFLSRFELLPTPQQERAQIRFALSEVASSGLRLGDKWFVLSQSWWNQWRQFVRFDNDELAPEGELFARPTAVDNAALQGDLFDAELKPDLVEGKDFVLLPETAWAKLIAWYGGGPIFPREVTKFGKTMCVELYPIMLQCERHRPPLELFGSEQVAPMAVDSTDTDAGPVVGEDASDGLPLIVSAQCTVSSLLALACKFHDVPLESSRIWYRLAEGDPSSADDSNAPKPLFGFPAGGSRPEQVDVEICTPMKKLVMSTSNLSKSSSQSVVHTGGRQGHETLEAIGLCSADYILVETKLHDGRWPLDVLPLKHEWTAFRVGDVIDVKDTVNKWYKSEILEVDRAGRRLFTHFIGWTARWDAWYSMDDLCHCKGPCACSHRLAKPGLQSLFTQRLEAQKQNKSIAVLEHEDVPNEKHNIPTAFTSPHNRSSVVRGVTGLKNLGNTCFMNSTLQCLAQTPVLVSFFVSQRFKADLNISNPLGSKGQLAAEFGALLQEMWSSQPVRSVAPTALKSALGWFSPQFVGFNQHDSQELLAVLLDGLHEDLNRIRKKPAYQAAPDCFTTELKAVSEAANIAWQNHRARNLSIIVELLQGQLQSTLRCPTCQRVSVTFDPFMYLSLPISAPVARDRRVSLTYLAAEGQTPIQLVVAVPHTGSIVQLQQAVATLMGTPSCIIAEAYKHRIYKVLNSRDSLSDIQPGDDLLAFGQEKPTEGSICVQVLHEVRPSEMSAPQLFGTPLVIELPPACPGHVLWALVATRVKMWLPSSLSKMPTQKMLDSIFAGKALPFRIRIREALRCGLCTRAQCTGCEVSRSLDDDRSCGVKSSHSIVLEWNTDMVREHADRFDQVAVHSSAQHSAPVKAHSESVTTLNDCVDAFISEERLGKNDTWYCSACKQHVMATKKLDLWRCPEVLIVHLKRFSAHREKIGRLVDFPLHGLDLSRFVRGAQEETAPVYDLFAVSNHMGGLHGGHYNAFSRNLENDRWYLCDDSHTEPVAEHAVKTEKAYVLFYRRRH